MSLTKLLDELGYSESPFYLKRGDSHKLPIDQAHLLRDAWRAGVEGASEVKGTYFIRTMGKDAGTSRERPAVHVAEAKTPDDAREIHRHLWNQGTTPFLLVSLPGQVRVYTPFAYDKSNETTGQVVEPINTNIGLREVAKHLQFLRADSIDSGEIWRTQGAHLQKDRRVDCALLGNLRALSHLLVKEHHLERKVAHALIGRFVYLYYLRERGILSDQWLASVNVVPNEVFSANVRLAAFRCLTEAVDNKFNGHIFPIKWSALNAEAVGTAGRAFAGENVVSGELPFRWTFDFSFIPIELLSAIYEQFLHDEGKGAKEGAFYTSEPVADYLLAEVESVKPLKSGMKVLDPCCGSGIFLVLAFRRLVEQEMRRRKTNHLPPTELRRILTSSIFGVERIDEACLVAEFSLILALLSYVHPPELDRHPNFKFPKLHNEQIFETDFFLDDSEFWITDQRFDWIVGNPPWVEIDRKKEEEAEQEKPLISWIQRYKKKHPVARYRSCEAFTWRVRERLADDGVVGLITQATTLTNDHSEGYRKAFFTQNKVHRITNLSNLAYLLFKSAEEPAANLVYSISASDDPKPDIIHFGPLVANQPATAPDKSRRHRVPWVLTICESEIQVIPVAEAMRGNAMTWKQALWGNPRDRRALERLRRILPTTLEQIAEERGWALSLGLQLRRDAGTKEEPNQDVATIKRTQGATEDEAEKYARRFAELMVVNPKNMINASSRLTLPEQWLTKNECGMFVRNRRWKGLNVIPAPHLFFWNEYAAFSDQDFIFCNPKIGLAGPPEDADWLKAISVIWASSTTRYYLFLNLNASWGISRSTIDLGDVRQMPMPELGPDTVCKLASLHAELAAEESTGVDRVDWQRRLDEGVASILSIPSQLMLLARDFSEFRLPLVKGKAPSDLTRKPDKPQLDKYATRLRSELDAFLESKPRRHAVTVLTSQDGIIATVELTDSGRAANASVRDADATEQRTVRDILKAAEKQYGQWVYVRRSVRVFSGRKIHICKPARRLEWTETQALLDATDFIAEVVDERGRKS